MEIINKSDEKLLAEYEQFASTSKYGNFMQSLKWPKVKDNWGWDAVISRDADGNIRGTCLIIIKKVPIFGVTFMYAPHGPVCDWSDKEVMTDLFEGVKVLAKKYKCYQFMWDPCFEEGDDKCTKLIEDMGFKHIHKAAELTTIQARNNYMLRNIEGKTPDEVMATFKPDWRNRIRKAPRKGVYCKACGTEALDDFYPLMQATGIRDGFSIRSKEYFVKMLNGLGPEHCRLFMCYVDEDGKQIPLSGAVTTQYAGKTCYVYGASANHHRNLYPNYLMQGLDHFGGDQAAGLELFAAVDHAVADGVDLADIINDLAIAGGHLLHNLSKCFGVSGEDGRGGGFKIGRAHV